MESDFIEFNCETNEEVIVDFTQNLSMCHKCDKYYIYQDNLCSYCLKGIKMCKKCKEYYAPINELFCSECKPEIQFDGMELTIDQILNLPISKFKGNMMSKNIELIFDFYKNQRNRKHKLLKNVNEFNILLNLCKGKSSGEIYCILDGYRDFNQVLLLAKFADQLLGQCLENIDSEKQYMYVHAIAPFIFDVWNTSRLHHVLECYYKDLGSLTTCPNSEKTLFELWECN